MEDLRREVLDGPDELQARVVDEDVRTGRRLLGGFEIGQVERVRNDGAGEPGRPAGECSESGLVAVGGPYGGACGGEAQRTDGADAARSSGDERGAAGEIKTEGACAAEDAGCVVTRSAPARRGRRARTTSGRR